MKALLPTFCRPLGYIILAISLFLPFLLMMWGFIDDSNLLFYKECIKLLMMVGCLMILLAFSKNETCETEKARVQAIRNAVFLTFLFIFFGVIYRMFTYGAQNISTSSFVIFLIINVLCLEFEMKKDLINKAFKR